MRALVMTEHGELDVLAHRDDVPDPAPGRGEVLIRVSASSVNNTDVWTRRGAYGTAEDPDAIVGWRGVAIDVPRIQGGDAVGTVEAVGVGAPEGLLGRRVLVDPARYGDDGETPNAVMGSEFDGGFAELVAVDAAHVHDVTDSPLTDHELAALPIAYGTAMGMLKRGDVGEGDRVVVTGASGGVGIAAVGLAAALGATVIGVTTADGADAVRRAGATATVDRHDGPPATQVVDQHGPIDAVIDVVGGSGFGSWLGALTPHGRIVVAGAVAGAVVEIDLRTLYLHQRRIIGSTMHTPAVFAELVEVAIAGGLEVPIAAVYPLEELVAAQEAFLLGDAVGKIVIQVAV